MLRATIGFSALALLYHVRWFISFLINDSDYVVPVNQSPLIWFITQIISNIVCWFPAGTTIQKTYSDRILWWSQFKGIWWCYTFLHITCFTKCSWGIIQQFYWSSHLRLEINREFFEFIFQDIHKTICIWKSADNVFSSGNYYMAGKTIRDKSFIY